MAFYLTDDGTLDTVVKCEDCGEELRYNYDIGGPDQVQGEDPDEPYYQFVDWVMDDAAEQHKCSTPCRTLTRQERLQGLADSGVDTWEDYRREK